MEKVPRDTRLTGQLVRTTSCYERFRRATNTRRWSFLHLRSGHSSVSVSTLPSQRGPVHRTFPELLRPIVAAPDEHHSLGLRAV